MRLHSMTVTAFGPFADSVEVDFDGLCEPGLFLLCGPTGAGKTSVLDAVCFALYGGVPGDRGAAQRLRCDTAAPGAPPRVVLEATVAGRRFRFSRSPVWWRPKKRGTPGLTRTQASVVVEECLHGSWVLLTNRMDEAGDLVGRLLGMSLTQFCQVAMLPQGRFQDFLRASSQDRQTLLQKLFRTHRFADIEQWLRERRIRLHREAEVHARAVAGLAHRLDEQATPIGVPLPVAVDELAAAAADGGLLAWSRASAGAATEQHARSAERLGPAEATAAASAAAHDAGVRLTELQARHRRAGEQLARLAADDDAMRGAAERRDLARRARPVTTVHAQRRRAQELLDQRSLAASDVVARCASVISEKPLDPGPDAALAERVSHALDARRDRLARARAQQPLERELNELTEALARDDVRRTRLAEAGHALDHESATAPERLEDLRADLETARDAATRVAHLKTEVERLQARHQAHADAARLNTELTEARELLSRAVDSHQHLKEAWLDLHERRITGMAAEIATALVAGEDCPVCGSCQHPHPAAAPGGAPTPLDEKAARRRVDDAEIERHSRETRVRELETSLSVLREQAGEGTAKDCEGALHQARAELEAARSQASRVERCRETLAQAESAAADLAARTTAWRVDLAAFETEHRQRRARRTALQETLDELLGDHASVTDLVAELGDQVDSLATAAAALDAHRQAAESLAQTEADLLQVARDCGFDRPEEATRAMLTDAELTDLEATISRHEQATHHAEELLADPELTAASVEPAPDLARLRAEAEAAARSHSDARAAHQVAETPLRRIDGLAQELEAALAAWTPVREAHALAASVAAFAEGKAADNKAQMRLSAYVLAWRLSQVVDAANERLAAMTDQRYTLVHADQRAAGETRGGLSLAVRDEWSGDTRDPVTLSGGETFVVSLALALGLTDVITQEAGGTDLGTLFVDEGFGSLDADTLDDVMDTLDSLRDGGRVVGVVSHVAELRTRIPTQLLVDKHRDGSTTKLVRAGG